MLKAKLNEMKVSLELKMVVIAILIPTFMDTLPNFFGNLYYLPFQFILAKMFSSIIGIFWTTVLVVGVVNLASRTNKNLLKYFNILFSISSWTTFVIYFSTLGSYFIVIITMFSNLSEFQIILLTYLAVVPYMYMWVIEKLKTFKTIKK